MKGRGWIAVWIVVGASLPAVAAHAADGVLEINQACVAAGCFAGDAAGFPVTTAAAGSYVLTSNLTVPTANTTAVTLGARSTLDLNGFAIVGPTTCTGQPAVCTGTGTGVGVNSGTTGGVIRNGTIRGMGSFGIRGGNDTRVEAVRIEGNGGDGIRGDSGSYGWRVERCSIDSNGGSGVDVNYGGGGSTLIQGNTMRWNGAYGVRGIGLLVIDNTLLGNANYGISGGGGYAQNVIDDNHGGPGNTQVLGLSQVGINICDGNTTCP